MKYDHVMPKAISGAELKNFLGKDYTCPFCLVESTKNEIDIKWVETPLIKKSPRYICLGCCIDIYSTCISSQFENHPYKDIVADSAKIAGRDIKEFRRICLDHQREIILHDSARLVKYVDPIELLDKINKIMEDELSQI